MSQTVYVLFTDAAGCQSTAAINIVVDAALCGSCPFITSLTDPADICAGGTFDLTATGLSSMAMADNGDMDFGIDFVHFGADNPVPTDPYTGGTSLGVVANGALTGTNPAQEAALLGVGGTLTEGTYQIFR